MDNSQQIDLILRILSGEDELADHPELKEFMANRANRKQLEEWNSTFGEAASLLREMKEWEEMPADQKDRIVQKAVQSFRETIASEGTPFAVEEILLVDESHKIVSVELREAITPEGIPGWIVTADNLTPGALRVRITEEGKGRLLAKEIAKLTIPSVSSATLSSEALAGQSSPDDTGKDTRDDYTTFKSVWDAAGAEHHLHGQVEGYVVPQQQGVRIVAFIPKSLSEETEDQA